VEIQGDAGRAEEATAVHRRIRQRRSLPRFGHTSTGLIESYWVIRRRRCQRRQRSSHQTGFAECLRHTDSTPPVDRQHPHHCVIAVELGKPIVFPSGWVGRVGALQSVLNRQRARDHGASERRVVITRIGDNVLYPKGALTSVWCGMARAYAESPRLEASKYEIR
jgi:hypothetical protein